MSPIKISCQFDAGSIVVHAASNPQQIRLSIRNDTNSHFAQWFYFQVNNAQGQQLNFSLEGLDKTAFPEGWQNYNVCASYNNQDWFRVPAEYANNKLSWGIAASANTIYFAYFEPYSYTRHLELIGAANLHPAAYHEVIGTSLEGRNLDLLVIGDETAQHKIWIIARQHPGETMAEWFMEGLIQRLLDDEDSTAQRLRVDCVFYLVPNMNPDGAILGNLRTNAAGANLNREWLTPSLERSAEVYHVRAKMLATGVDMFFDIHGDESLPYVFTAGCDDNPSYSAKQARLADLFTQLWSGINPDYQTVHGYAKGHFSSETATVATSWVGNQFDALAFTIEMPFKDNANLPNLDYGWNGNRSAKLGESLLTALNQLIA